jgi:hypothetical protein
MIFHLIPSYFYSVFIDKKCAIFYQRGRDAHIFSVMCQNVMALRVPGFFELKLFDSVIFFFMTLKTSVDLVNYYAEGDVKSF